MDRVYLPGVWLDDQKIGVEVLRGAAATSQLREVIDRCLVATRALMQTANKLPGKLQNRRLAMESAVIVNIANKLIEELERRDPLAERVVLSKGQLALCTVSGIVRGALRF